MMRFGQKSSPGKRTARTRDEERVLHRRFPGAAFGLTLATSLIRRIVLHYVVDALRTGDTQIQAGALAVFIDT